MQLCGKSASTIRTVISGLNYVNQVLGYCDITKNFIVQKTLAGIQNITPRRDIRVPITQDILLKLCNSLPLVVNDNYKSLLINAMFNLAFHAFLRIGEITVISPNYVNNNLLQLHQLSIGQTGQVSITFYNYKHHQNAMPFVLTIPTQPVSDNSPPLHRTLSQYLSSRGLQSGPLFLFRNKPVNRSFFTSILRSALLKSNLSPSHIKSHSFRIGAATTALLKGYTEEQIQQMGRWNSKAFTKYFRVQSFTV